MRALSRGLLQRCALARVLLHEPELLFLDEPFTGLDLDARDLLCDVLREAQQRGATLLMSTHDVGLGLAAVLERAWCWCAAASPGRARSARPMRPPSKPATASSRTSVDRVADAGASPPAAA